MSQSPAMLGHLHGVTVWRATRHHGCHSRSPVGWRRRRSSMQLQRHLRHFACSKQVVYVEIVETASAQLCPHPKPPYASLWMQTRAKRTLWSALRCATRVRTVRTYAKWLDAHGAMSDVHTWYVHMDLCPCHNPTSRKTGRNGVPATWIRSTCPQRCLSDILVSPTTRCVKFGAGNCLVLAGSCARKMCMMSLASCRTTLVASALYYGMQADAIVKRISFSTPRMPGSNGASTASETS